jgi:hypothetical protein
MPMGREGSQVLPLSSRRLSDVPDIAVETIRQIGYGRLKSIQA